MITLTQVLQSVSNDIQKTLSKHSPLTQDELYQRRGIAPISYDSYSYGLDKAIRDKDIMTLNHTKSDGTLFYQLATDSFKNIK